MCWHGAGHCGGAGAELAALLAALGADFGLRTLGDRRILADVPQNIHLLWCFARHGRDAGYCALDGPLGAWLWFLGGLLIATKYIAVYALYTCGTACFLDNFNAPWLNWLGLITRKPITEDYVPLLPWMGVMWWGVAAGAGFHASIPAVGSSHCLHRFNLWQQALEPDILHAASAADDFESDVVWLVDHKVKE